MIDIRKFDPISSSNLLNLPLEIGIETLLADLAEPVELGRLVGGRRMNGGDTTR
jgi:hypothetical protein